MTRFESFVVFAEMRTGSNLLESNLNALDGVTCFGEAFNPQFVGYPDKKNILGLDKDMRDGNPLRLLEVIKTAPGILGGFRYFNDHDPRVFDAILADPLCAKIILTRNPIDSYVSLRIANATGQWKLTNAKHAKSASVRFDEAEFTKHLSDIQGFQMRLLHGLQCSGQTAFYVDYDDLLDLDVMNGLAAWLGVEARLEALDPKLKKQNPTSLEDKVRNFPELEAALARMDRFNLNRTPNFEPRRGPAVPTYVAAGPLMFMPIKSGPEAAVRSWMSSLGPLEEGFSQKTLRQWRRQHSNHRSFTVLRHPVARAHSAFCDKILPVGPGTFGGIRKNLCEKMGMSLPDGGIDESHDNASHRAAFLIWLAFLKSNLSGQSNLRTDPSWASQSTVLQGMAGFASPDMIIRESALQTGLEALTASAGVTSGGDLSAETDPHAARLREVYDGEIEKAARAAYANDYEVFGFGNLA